MDEKKLDSTPARDGALAVIGTGAVILITHLLFSGFFPGPNGVGHDYAGGLTQFLAEYYWSLAEGPWRPAWFTPAFCGGIPLYADPVNQFFSLAGLLMRFTDVDPLTGNYLTFLVFAGAGFLGTYFFVRYRLSGSLQASLLAGVVFGLNGFLASRMLVGHSIYHGFMLVPLVAFLLTDAGAKTPTISSRMLAVGFASLSVAYWLYSGAGPLVMPFALAIVPLIGLAWLRGGNIQETLFRASASMALTVAISASKLSASFAYMQSFPRSGYLLPGYNGILETLQVLFLSLFGNSTDIAQFSQARLTNVQWFQDRHELEFGVTWVPLILLIVALLRHLLRRAPNADVSRRPARTALIGLLIGATLVIPIALNTYEEGWNALLKSLPFIGSSSALFRWFVIYVPIVAVLAGLAIDSVVLDSKHRTVLSAVSVVGVLVILASVDRSYYLQQSYDPSPVLTAFAAAKSDPASRPPIRGVGAFVDQRGNILLPSNRQDLIVQGISQVACYVPIFGYRLEYFPFRSLRPGSVFESGPDGFNMKNPACFVFPEENSCVAGDHFSIAQRSDLERFVDYRSFDHAKSKRQIFSDYLSIVALISVLVALAWVIIRRFVRDGRGSVI